MKKVYCLYRVSTKKQVDKAKDDIPMQRIACQEFVKQQGWVIAKEFLEKGVSGFKVSAENRDAIVELKEAAARGEFDVLLVYMFDRLGRRDDETPFVVEWFVKQGIEVWSTQEGQQRFENQTDKLLNYIRYWQANGESTKTSMRLKTRTAQLVAEGIYRGGAVPFGYRAVNKGRLNKKGQPVKDLEINPQEAEYVKQIFHKTFYEGYGSFRVSEYLNNLGVRTHNDKKFQCRTVIDMLRNRLYCGYYVVGETTSPKLENLVIIDEKLFDGVQHILDQRKKKTDEKLHIAKRTQGKTLLSGNLYCAHCGGHLVATSGKDSYVRKDGVEVTNTYLRYICYHRSRKLPTREGKICDGQSIYSAPKIDEAVETIVKQYLSAIKKTPRDKALEVRYKKEIAEKKKVKRELQDKNKALEKELTKLSMEIGKCLCGKSQFSADMLSLSIKSTEDEISENNKLIYECDTKLEQQAEVLSKLDYYYNQFVSWADEYDNATNEQKKMIICQLITEIKIGKGYNIEIEFNSSYKQFFGEEMVLGEAI